MPGVDIQPYLHAPAREAPPRAEAEIRRPAPVPLPAFVLLRRQGAHARELGLRQALPDEAAARQLGEDRTPELPEVHVRREEVPDVPHPAAHGARGLGAELLRVRPERARERLRVRVEEQRAVVQHPAAAEPLRRAGDLPALDADVVPARELRRDAQRGERAAHGPGQRLHAQRGRVQRVGYEGVVEVPEVVIHRPAPGHAPHDADAVRADIGRVHLLRGVLVEPDDDRIRVLPEHQPVALAPVFQHELLKSQVESRVSAARLKIVQGHVAPPSQLVRKL